MDVSTYNKSQTLFLNVTNSGAQKDHIPVTFGPTLLNVMSKVSKDIGGAEYMMGRSMLRPSVSSDPHRNLGLPFLKPDDPMIADLAVAAHQILGGDLDALLLGNVGTPLHKAPLGF